MCSYAIYIPTNVHNCIIFSICFVVLVEVEDELLDEAYIDYFAEVEKEVSVIEYRQLRRNWLDYQKCTTEVVGFCKKTKILLRGADRLVSTSYCMPKFLHGEIIDKWTYGKI